LIHEGINALLRSRGAEERLIQDVDIKHLFYLLTPTQVSILNDYRMDIDRAPFRTLQPQLETKGAST